MPDEPITDPVEAPPDVTDLRRERDDFRDRWMRKSAEFDNYRKRVERDRREQAEALTADALLSDLLPIIDDLERALKAPSGGDVDAFRKGVELIHRQMTELLRKRGVKTIDARRRRLRSRATTRRSSRKAVPTIAKAK